MSTAPLLIEIGCEEIPARMIPAAASELAARVVRILETAGFAHGDSRAWGGSRRLSVLVEDVQGKQDEREELLLGPPAGVAFDADGKPTPAARGFAGKHGLDPAALQTIESPKGSRVGVQRTVPGRWVGDALGETLPAAIRGMPFPKTMRWADGGSRWVRPVHWLLALHGARVLPVEVFGVTAGNRSAGHRFLGKPWVEVAGADVYPESLEAEHVIVAPQLRRERILAGLIEAARGQGGVLVEDPGLLDEVTDLVEWPGVVAGTFDASFLELPRELLVTTLRHHQKCFSVQDAAGRLLPAFLAVTNAEADASGHIRRGNEWVVVGRLEDARFFWNEDRQIPLAERADELQGVVFHADSGSFALKAERMSRLARALAERLELSEGDVAAAQRAAALAKVDLVTSLVGEFPELQGVVGGLLLSAEGEEATVARAVYEHYRPVGPTDAIPQSDAAAVVAVADKLDSLSEMLRAGQRPTGSRDPFGLRRASNGILRITIEREWPLALSTLAELVASGSETEDLLRERLVGYLRDTGYTPNEVLAVLRPGQVSDASEDWPLPDVVARLEAIKTVRGRDDFHRLVKLTERVDTIMTKNADRLSEIADEAGDTAHDETVDAAVELGRLVERLETAVAEQSRERRYGDVVAALSELIEPVDRFFADVLVLDPAAPAATRDRGRLLGRLRGILTGYFDIRELAGQAERRSA